MVFSIPFTFKYFAYITMESTVLSSHWYLKPGGCFSHLEQGDGEGLGIHDVDNPSPRGTVCEREHHLLTKQRLCKIKRQRVKFSH